MYPVLPSANTRTHHHSHQLDSSNIQRHSRSINGNKRSSSMIFRIEHLLPNATIASTASESALSMDLRSHPSSSSSRGTNEHSTSPPKIKLHARSGVHVTQFTPRDTRSETFSTLSVMSTNGANSSGLAEQTAYCNLSNDMLCMTPTILRKIKLSEDLHSYNALFELHNGNVRVRVIRDIVRDDELVAWFGEEATLLMSIPFLTPLNIQGNNRYTCHLCHLSFESPNPLKIHLALSCGRQSMDILWIRLHYALKATTTSGQHLLPPITLTSHLFPPLPSTTAATSSHKTYASPQHSPIDPTTSSTSSISPSNSPHELHRLSAFRPISTLADSATSTARMLTSLQPTSSATTTTSTLHPTMLPHMGLLPSGASANPLNAAAQIEAIVSNMGASKQGHLCIYCGKVYSRKYGLKIHIRTHTGFKPLKCKFCLRPFGDPSNLNKHVRLHLQSNAGGASSDATNEGYKCHLCPKTLARRRDLQRHLESRHTGEHRSRDVNSKTTQAT